MTKNDTQGPTAPASDEDRVAAAEAGAKLVWVEILRNYPRGGVIHKPGATIQVPSYAVKSMTDAVPPFGKRTSAPST